MTDVSIAVMSLLMTVGLLLVALKHVSLRTGRAFIYAGTTTFCAHAIGMKVVAPISEASADSVSWVTIVVMTATVVFLAGRGLVRIVQKDKSAISRAAN